MNILQSVAERAPVVVELAVRIPNTPVRLLYVSGHTAESAVSPILVATVDVRAEREPEREVKLLERLATVPESVFTVPESVLILPVIVATVPLRAFCARVSVKYRLDHSVTEVVLARIVSRTTSPLPLTVRYDGVGTVILVTLLLL